MISRGILAGKPGSEGSGEGGDGGKSVRATGTFGFITIGSGGGLGGVSSLVRVSGCFICISQTLLIRYVSMDWYHRGFGGWRFIANMVIFLRSGLSFILHQNENQIDDLFGNLKKSLIHSILKRVLLHF
jgi:hypothetical protein